MRNTKFKSVAYIGTGANRVVATMAESLKMVYPTYLKAIFGEAYKDVVTEEIKYKLSAPATRMLTGLWLNNYTRLTVSEVIAQLPVDDNTKKAIAKKVKGVKYDTDKKNLIAIGGFDEKTAEEYAYFISEAAIWENFMRLMQANKKATDKDIAEALELINGAVVVEETPKIAIEVGA
ncbi:hypothetical protein SDC9_162667 [bioreactor metagenome]|uniref:Uncharacterized protein n=1 Tax=bioreactor metagenome TaxID=1076179 RepID=A0A645FNQ8_9ZZZZ